MVIEMLLVLGAAATGVCFVRGHRGLGLLGVATGVAAFTVYLVVGIALESALPGLVAALGYAAGMVVAAVRISPRSGAARPRQAAGRRTRRAVVGALIGSIPGALIIIVPLALHAVGVISSDQSQIGFLGIFFVPAGMLAGALVAALVPPRSAHQAPGRHDPPLTD